AATDFYAAHRTEMDRGSRVAWPERKHDDELSGLQHLENLAHDLGLAAFSAEYLNLPLRTVVEADVRLTPADVCAKCNGLPRGVPPLPPTTPPAFLAPHAAFLFGPAGAGPAASPAHAVDWGASPPQRKRMFTLRKAEPTLADLFPTAGREGAIHAGL